MKERGHMTSDSSNRTQTPSPSTSHNPRHSPPPHHDHRHNRKPLGGGGGGGGSGEEPWRTTPTRGADINLLANSLSTRLRKAARHKTAPSSSSGTTPPTTTTSGSRSAPPEESVRKFHSSTSKRDSQGQMPPSILKRKVSKEMEQQQRLRQQQRAGSLSPREGEASFHLPDVFLTKRWSSSAGQLHHLSREEEEEVFNNQYLDRPSPALAILGSRGAGGGGGGGASTRTHVGNGQVAWVKRAGIFQPADKYASGRQTLHGEDQPFGRVQAVDYETVTLPSRAATDTPDSDLTSGWSSGKSCRRKGLKVSWKQPGDSEAEEDASRHADTAMSRRQKSAGTVHSEPGVYSFVKPKFNPGRSQVPSVGVKWKVPTPVVGRAPTDTEQDTRTPENHHTGHHSPLPSTATTPTQYPPPPSSSSPQTQRVTFSGKQSSSSLSSSTSQEVRHHPWRALYPRDVHPVTTAMAREGTSVSKTKWRVPSLRPVPAFTFIEDLMEAGGRQWHPSLQQQQHRLATHATVDGQSMQDRLKDAVGSLSSKDPATTTATVSNVSSSLDQDLEASSRS